METLDLSGMSRDELEQFAVEVCTERQALQCALAQAENQTDAAALLELQELRKTVALYEEQLRILREKRFGRKSEASPLAGQLCLFNEAEQACQPQAQEPQMVDVHPPKKPKRPKQKGQRDQFLKPLPKETLEYRLSEQEAVCPACGNPLATMKKELRKELIVLPARVKVREHVRYAYVCPHCEAEEATTVITRAPAPEPLLRGSLLSPSLAALLICRKYDNRDPLYKISQDFHLQGLHLSRQTLANWIVRLAEDYGNLLLERMRLALLFPPGGEGSKGEGDGGLPPDCPIVHMDETPLQVLQEPGRTAEQKSSMWVLSRGGEGPPIQLYHYAPSKSGAVAADLLKGYQGYVQSDGYVVYHHLPGVINVGCLAHVRRKYRDAANAQPKGTVEAQSGAGKGVAYCEELLRLDAQRKQLPGQAQLEYKRTTIQPILEGFLAWAKQEQAKVPEKSALGKALAYTGKQAPYLRNYLLDGRLEMTNNAAERAVRPFVMGRKNWLFSNTPRGANSSATLYSLVQTAKGNGVDPYAWLEWVLEEMKDAALTDEFLDRLLPWSEYVPKACRIPGEEPGAAEPLPVG